MYVYSNKKTYLHVKIKTVTYNPYWPLRYVYIYINKILHMSTL